MYNEVFKNRKEVGLLLADQLEKYRNTNSIVLAIPRGGVPVAYEISKKLKLPLDVILSKKIGHPYNKEFAIGAVSLETMVVHKHSEVSEEYINSEVTQLRKQLKEKYKLYRGNYQPLAVKGKNIILVDDGIATGSTLLASIAMLRKSNPSKIIVAVPVAPEDAIVTFQVEADEFICLTSSKYFNSVGEFYEDFRQVEDDEVIHMLNEMSYS